ncbi:MAG TPA: hypothetical protein VFE05_05690 [Longimicrobiaceae bacterium]|nr:hypothetical protein [Longimicrobiaceae bacterium]
MILDDAPDDYGLLLWQAFRNVLLWAGTPYANRGLLFDGAAKARRYEQISAVVGEKAEERVPLLTLAEVLDPMSGVGNEAVADACTMLQEVAAQRGHRNISLAFAIATAAATPADAGRAYRVAGLLRNQCESSWADAWYRRCAELALASCDWKHHGLAFIGVGHIAAQQGDWDSAERHFKRALYSARRHGVWQVKGMALHNLFTVAVTQDDYAKATRLGRETFNAYGSNHPRLPALAHDVAFFWMMRGLFSQAMTVFEALANQFSKPDERLLALSNVARAAGGDGDLHGFNGAWNAALPLAIELTNSVGETSAVTEAWVNLAHGAASIGDVQKGILCATEASTVATRRKQEPERAQAEAILGSLRSLRGVRRLVVPAERRGRETEAAANTFALELRRALVHR